jgi:hypothetical protein
MYSVVFLNLQILFIQEDFGISVIFPLPSTLCNLPSNLPGSKLPSIIYRLPLSELHISTSNFQILSLFPINGPIDSSPA